MLQQLSAWNDAVAAILSLEFNYSSSSSSSTNNSKHSNSDLSVLTIRLGLLTINFISVVNFLEN